VKSEFVAYPIEYNVLDKVVVAEIRLRMDNLRRENTSICLHRKSSSSDSRILTPRDLQVTNGFISPLTGVSKFVIA
jgi:hypothetical protein